MEDFEILIKGPDRFKPHVQREYDEFDIVLTPHTHDSRGPYEHEERMATDTLFDEPKRQEPGAPHSLCVPVAASAGIRYTQGKINRLEAERELANADDHCWMAWRPTDGGQYATQTDLGTVAAPGKTARTICSHVRSWCAERRCHTDAEVRRFRDCMMLQIFAIDSSATVYVGPENVRPTRQTCYTMRGNAENIITRPFTEKWARTMSEKYAVRTKQRLHCRVSVATENAVRALLLEVFQIMYVYLPPDHRYRRGEFERSIKGRLLHVSRDMVRGGGCVAERVHNMLASIVGCRAVKGGPDSYTATSTSRWILSTPLFEYARHADGNDDAMLRYVALHLLLSCTPGAGFQDTVIPLAQCLNDPHRQERRTETLGQLCDATLGEWLRINPHCPQYGSPASQGMVGNLRLLLGRLEAGDAFFAFKEATIAPVRNLGVAHALYGGICGGHKEILTCLVPYRAPRKCFLCLVLCNAEVEDNGVDEVVRTRVRGVEDSCIGRCIIRLNPEGVRVRTSGDLRTVVEQYAWCYTSGTCVIVKPRSATREGADFMTKVLRFRD
uniref:Outer capsid protein VP2 n=1 Tax=Kemerovo virus TaxID=40064 RepID=A0A5S9ECL2_9REOV|nr:outer capsid protein VP2 [Kemerovo virus]